jgi:hypothetical protein
LCFFVAVEVEIVSWPLTTDESPFTMRNGHQETVCSEVAEQRPCSPSSDTVILGIEFQKHPRAVDAPGEIRTWSSSPAAGGEIQAT